MEVVVDGNCGSSDLVHDGERVAIKIDNEKGKPPYYYYRYTDDWSAALFLSRCHGLPAPSRCR